MSEIWADSDVRQVCAPHDGGSLLRLADVPQPHRGAIERFVAADNAIDQYATTEMVITALMRGVEAFESLPDEIPGTQAIGWKKFILFMTACNVQILWDQHRLAKETAIFGDWAVTTISGRKWGPDGNVSALGRAHSMCLAIAGAAGGGRRAAGSG